MADSFVQVPTDGSGKKIDTRTEAGGDHRQVIVIGDPSATAGVAPVDATKGLAVDLSATGANATPIVVDGSAVTQPVSGTVTVQQATASNLKVDLSDTAANATAIKVDGSAVTQPVSGTVTAAQATASSLKCEPAGNAASGAADSGNPIKVGGKYNSTPITLTDGQRGDLQLDANGYQKVNVAAGAAGNAAASATGSAVPASADYEGINVSGTLRGQTGVNPSGSVYAAQVDIASVGGTAVTSVPVKTENQLDYDTGGGTVSQSVMGIALPGSGGPVAGGTATNPIRTDPTGTTAQTVDLTKVGGASVAVGHGTASGAVRVELPTDGTGVVGLNTGANLVGYVGGKSTYAGKTTITSTNWVSLANGSGWQSAAIATSGAKDVHIWLETQSTGTAYCDFYIATKLSNGTGYTDGATGSEGTFTAANRLNSRYLGSVRLNNAQAQAQFSLSDIFGGCIPANIVLIGINNSGASINSTGGNTVFEYELVN